MGDIFKGSEFVGSDDERKSLGSYFTPFLFAKRARDYMDDTFGTQWRNWLVWDGSCGTKNLTSGEYFPKLYLSTLVKDELLSTSCINPEARAAFQWDFLNGEFSELPMELQMTIMNNQPITFFMNPPYSANTGDGANAGNKTGGNSVDCHTKTWERMRAEKIGYSQNLWGQFMYRIIKFKQDYNLTNVRVALFGNATFMTSSTCESFRQFVGDNLHFQGGFTFNCNNFEGCREEWPVVFTMWSAGKTTDTTSFILNVLDEDGVEVGTHNFENGFETVFKSDNSGDGEVFGTLNINGDGLKNVSWTNMHDVDSKHADDHKRINITADNFDKAMGYVAMSEGVQHFDFTDWSQISDYFAAPNYDDPEFRKFAVNAAVFNTMQCKNHITSHGSHRNQLSPIDPMTIRHWAEEVGAVEVIDDLESYNDIPFMVDFIYWGYYLLTDEAIALLDLHARIVKKSLLYRSEYYDIHKDKSIYRWDLGYTQLLSIMKDPALMDNFKAERKELTKCRKALADVLKPYVYRFGYLRSRPLFVSVDD